MTTGRINQVTTSPKDVCIHAASFANCIRKGSFQRRRRSSLQKIRLPGLVLNHVLPTCAAIKTGKATILASTTLFPDLTSFESALRVQRTQITILGEDYLQTGRLKSSAVETDPRVVQCTTGLAISKESTPFTSSWALVTKEQSPTQRHINPIQS